MAVRLGDADHEPHDPRHDVPGQTEADLIRLLFALSTLHAFSGKAA
jgi:hypothetical protein